jgi:hypothetical protein
MYEKLLKMAIYGEFSYWKKWFPELCKRLPEGNFACFQGLIDLRVDHGFGMNCSDTAVFFSTWGVQMHQSVGLSKGWRYGLTLFTPMTGWLPIQKIAADVIRLVPNFESGIFLGTHFDVAYMVYGWVYHVAKLQLVDSS